MFGTIVNPYLQEYAPQFGDNTSLPANIDNFYKNLKGNTVNAINASLQYPNSTRLPVTITKAGESLNDEPKALPQNMVNIKFPQRSTSTHAIIDQPMSGVQLGEPDIYRDSPYRDWTYGIQFYSINQGKNPKTDITPIIYPQAYRKPVWAQDYVEAPQINNRNIIDITDLDMDRTYGCKSCDIASASMGTPVMYEPRNPNAPLPVAAYPGEYPNIGYYTGREIGVNTRDYPRPQNPIMTLQRRKMGLSNPPILADYDNNMLKDLRHGFIIS